MGWPIRVGPAKRGRRLALVSAAVVCLGASSCGGQDDPRTVAITGYDVFDGGMSVRVLGAICGPEHLAAHVTERDNEIVVVLEASGEDKDGDCGVYRDLDLSRKLGDRLVIDGSTGEVVPDNPS